ncbi:hypothetical protein [Cyanobium usitatum]|uniref:hypothetical protein n=1 Tax=Cyanobium usitatum TaxID=2304190 RepID=UPI002AD46FD3|nr:hypothetical protein [Cyanobium usitatum]
MPLRLMAESRCTVRLFVAVLVLSLGGTLLLGIDSYRFHTVPEHRLVQRMTIIVVPMLQSTVVIAIAPLLQAYRMLAGRGRAGAGRSRRR